MLTVLQASNEGRSNMSHRFSPIVAVVVIALSLAVSSGAQQTDWDAVEIKAQQVAPGIHMLIGQGGNIGVSSGEDGVLIVDDQYAPLTDKILAAIKKISSDPVRFVVNTHWHGDHTGGNENMGKVGSVIVAHENVRKRLSSDTYLRSCIAYRHSSGGHFLLEQQRIYGYVEIDGVVGVFDLYRPLAGSDLPDLACSNRGTELLELRVDQCHVAVGFLDEVKCLFVDV
jgi:hypothetical protein